MDKCKICPNEFKRKYPKGGQRKIYCSKKCRYADSYVLCKCKTCGIEYNRNIISRKSDEFCSLACIQRHPCQLCGTMITGRKSFQSGEKRFCTRKCANFFYRTMASKKAYVAKGFAQTIQKFHRIQCERCGINDIRVLCVHHINSDRGDNCYTNLETLCANCHHKEHWGDSTNRIKMQELASLLSKQILSPKSIS